MPSAAGVQRSGGNATMFEPPCTPLHKVRQFTSSALRTIAGRHFVPRAFYPNPRSCGSVSSPCTPRYSALTILSTGNGLLDAAMRKAIAKLPRDLVRTITWDQGKEMHRHASFTVDTGVQIYFCDPRSPWQRGSNENTNGLLRQYMPKGTDLSTLTAKDLDRIARSLNDRPRETLGFMKPSEKLAELLALTD